jgi:hypothetical protein
MSSIASFGPSRTETERGERFGVPRVERVAAEFV